ncbi:hypothetical protein P4O66_008596, partial [Electrophorus voltai]
QVTMATKMVIQQPKLLVVAPGSDQWSTSICECDTVNDCCFALWCFPCFACITARDHGECLCLPLLDAFGLIPPITMSMGVSVRRTYGIEDSLCNDCVYACCCGPCSWCQIRRELKARHHPVTLFHNRAKLFGETPLSKFSVTTWTIDTVVRIKEDITGTRTANKSIVNV